MKTILINTDASSAKLFLALARKLQFKARVLNKHEKEDAALLAMMEERREEEVFPITRTYEILRKLK